jgi:hypothetical protein
MVLPLASAGRGRRNCDRADTDFLGIISGLTAFVWGEWSFYGIRFLLGLAEAEGLHFVGVLSFGDEFREDVVLVSIEEKFGQPLA